LRDRPHIQKLSVKHKPFVRTNVQESRGRGWYEKRVKVLSVSHIPNSCWTVVLNNTRVLVRRIPACTSSFRIWLRRDIQPTNGLLFYAS